MLNDVSFPLVGAVTAVREEEMKGLRDSLMVYLGTCFFVCRSPCWDSGCGSGFECQSSSIQDPATDCRLSDLLEHRLW